MTTVVRLDVLYRDVTQVRFPWTEGDQLGVVILHEIEQMMFMGSVM